MNTQSLQEKVDKLFEPYTALDSPGCAVAVMKDGNMIYKKGYGLANIEHNVPITPSTVFNIGSESKQFTAMAILLLESEGKLSLDGDMRKYLPEMRDFGDIVTIRHLIHHTGGIRCTFPALIELSGWRHEDMMTYGDQWTLIKAQQALNFKPGDEYSYSNAGYALLAFIVEKISGQSFATFCKERIFEPLGMKDTCVHDDPMMLIKNHASSYWQNDGHYFNAILSSSELGATNVYTTIEDLALWDENYYTGKVGGLPLIEKMLKRGTLNNGEEIIYACGLAIDKYRGLKTVEHGGLHGGFNSFLLRFPEQHFSVVVLFNLFVFDARPFAIQVADIYLDDVLEVEKSVSVGFDITPIELDEEQLQEKAQIYFHATRKAVREVTINKGKLHVNGVDLLPLSENHFVVDSDPGVKVNFVSATADTPAKMQIDNGTTAYWYEQVEKAKLTSDDLKAYTGHYYSPELDVHWFIVLEDEQLMIRRKKLNSSPLNPVFVDAFFDDWAEVTDYPHGYFVAFERDENGAISGFGVSDDRVRNVKFFKQDE